MKRFFSSSVFCKYKQLVKLAGLAAHACNDANDVIVPGCLLGTHRSWERDNFQDMGKIRSKDNLAQMLLHELVAWCLCPSSVRCVCSESSKKVLTLNLVQFYEKIRLINCSKQYFHFVQICFLYFQTLYQCFVTWNYRRENKNEN